MDNNDQYHSADEEKNPPALNIPAIMTSYVAVLVLVHAIRQYLVSRETDFEVLLAFSFIPARYVDLQLDALFPLAKFWSPLTYGFLHGDWMHLLMNVIWMVAFGAAVARRFGNLRFVLFCAVTSIGGAAAHYLFFAGDMVPVIGASAVVSGFMGAASRFALGQGRFGKDLSRAPALNLVQTFSNKQVLVFLGVWFAINFLFGSGILQPGEGGQTIAWQAHVGGFLSGLLLFSVFDPPRNDAQRYDN